MTGVQCGRKTVCSEGTVLAARLLLRRAGPGGAVPKGIFVLLLQPRQLHLEGFMISWVCFVNRAQTTGGNIPRVFLRADVALK